MNVEEHNHDLTGYYLREVDAQKDGMYEWTDENSDNFLLADFEFVRDLRGDYVKVGRWDMDKNQEVEEDEYDER